MLSETEATRFRAKYVVDRAGCWLWQGPLDKDGYGHLHFRRKRRSAHRVGWYSAHGEIPAGFVVDHVCGKRSCVNPSHLRLQTIRQNTLENSRSISAINAQKTHCSKGHPFDRLYGKQRYCSVCSAAKSKRLRKKWAAEDTLRV